MYTIAGRLGFKRGPFTAEQVREKIAAGRLGPHARARRQGSSRWQPLGGFPEFADSFAVSTTPALAPPATGAAETVPSTAPSVPPARDVAALAEALLGRGFRVDIANCFKRSWELLVRDPLAPVGAAIGAILAFALLDYLVDLLLLGAIWLNPTVHHTVAIVLGGLVACGLTAFYLHQIRAPEPLEAAVELGTAWAKEFHQVIHGNWSSISRRAHGFGPRLAQLTLAVLALSAPLAVGAALIDVGRYLPATAGGPLRLAVGLGRLAAAVPVAYFAVAWWLAPVLVLDQRFPAREALELSRRVMTRHWGPAAVVVAGTLFIGCAGYLLCRVGLLAAVPFGLIAVLYMYEDIFGVRGEEPAESDSP